MSKYEESIKCKYCSHFEPGANHCHLYHDYDQSLNKNGGGPYLKETSPDSRCSHFGLTAMDVMVKGMVGNRPDGSYIVSLNDDPELKEQLQSNEASRSNSHGCYIATCVYGSYDCPQVWTLRRFRDQTLAATWYGRVFINIYYAVSPTLVKWFGCSAWFKKMWSGKLDALVAKLHDNGVDDTPYIDKE